MKKNLDEVSFMRPILIVLVVLYHAMAIHTGNWDLPEGTPQIGAYAAVGRIAYMFMLEAFVFMSGYVWAFQREQRGAEPFGVLVKKKSYRLLVPCYLFGILYALLFERATPLMENVVRVFTGIGHLWFLVMLFVCFVALWALLKWIPKTRWWGIFLLFAMLALFSSYPQSFRLSNIMYYPLYFFFGYVMYSNREHMMSRTNVGKVLSAWIVFLVLYAGLSYVRGRFMEQADEGDLLEMLKKGCRLCYTIAGVMAFYITRCRSHVFRRVYFPTIHTSISVLSYVAACSVKPLPVAMGGFYSFIGRFSSFDLAHKKDKLRQKDSLNKHGTYIY